MKKICFIIDELYDIGGLQKITLTIANSLSENGDLEISILQTSRLSNSKDLPYKVHSKIQMLSNVTLHRKKFDYILEKLLTRLNKKYFKINNTNLLMKILFPSSEIKKYQDYFTENHFDILVGVTPRNAGLISLLDVSSRKIGWVHNTVERYFNLENEAYWNQKDVYYQLFQKLDELVVLNDHDKKEYHDTFNVTPTRIYNPLTFTSKEKSSLETNNILFIGRIYYKTKGLDLLLKSIKILKDRKVSFTLNVVGDGPDMDRFKIEIEKLDLKDFIVLHGFQDDVLSYYLTNSLLVLPSTIEGFGLVVTEAMEVGLPVVSYATEGPSEIITNGRDGYLIEKYDYFEFANKIEDMLLDEATRKKIGNNSMNSVKKFSIDKIIPQWIEIFQ